MAPSEELRQMIKDEEHLGLVAYRDANGWSIGWGHFITDKQDLSRCQRGLAATVTMTLDEAERTLTRDLTWADNDFELLFRNLGISGARRDALTAMIFQLGFPRFKEFDRMIASVYKGDWESVARHMLDSKLAQRDTPARAKRIARMLRSGEYV